MSKEKVLLTGASSYIGRSMSDLLSSQNDFQIVSLSSEASDDEILEALSETKQLIHLAERKTGTEAELYATNVKYTEHLISLMELSVKPSPIIFISSEYDDSIYGRSKLMAELLIRDYGQRQHVHNMIYRIPILLGEKLYMDEDNPLELLCHRLLVGENIVGLPDQAEHKFVDIRDLVQEIYRALSGRAFFATIDRSICVVPSEHLASWKQILQILEQIRTEGGCFMNTDIPDYSLEAKLYRTYNSLAKYYLNRGSR